MRTGGSTEERRKEMHARQELIKQHLMKTPNKPIKYAELSGLFDVSADTIRVNCLLMAESDFTIQFIRGAVLYVPPTRYSDKKTEEGYSDPTAHLAIKSIEGKDPVMQDRFKMPKAGDVWDIKCTTGNVEKYIVLAVNADAGYATCIQYFPEGVEMDESCKKLFSKPLKYFLSRTWGTPLSQLTGYREKIAEYLDIEPAVEEKIVEKVVEKVVEVPVEVPIAQEAVVECASDKIYTQADMDKMRAEIYKECLYLMAGRKEM